MVINEFQDKKWPKNIIKFIQSFFRRVSNERICLNGYRLRTLKCGAKESFFGYYDRSPISEDGKYILFHTADQKTRLNPSKSHPISLCLYNLNNDEIVNTWEIKSYNWQQGCKPQWIDNNRFIFNNYDDELKAYYSTVVNINDMSELRLNLPSYDSCSNYILSLNFYRLSKFRPDYGYRNISGMPLCDDLDGIFCYSLRSNKEYLLLNIERLKNLNPLSSMIGANHKVNHIMISPDQSKFIFMHRWINKVGKTDRLYVYDFENGNITCIADYGMVSHCYWIDDNTIIGYMNGPERKPGYYIIDIRDKSIKRLPEKIQNFGDGHPHCRGAEVLFDTYPDAKRMKHLFRYNIETDELNEIAAFYEPLGYENQCRCDLHPRIVSDTIFSVDSTHSGKRKLLLLEKVK